jgi:hypothetical protein
VAVTTINSTRRKRLLRLIPPRQCVAVANAGEQCQHWAMIGATVCHKHGGKAPQIMKAAAQRITLAEALLNGDRRHPQEVLASALHQVDVLGSQTVQTIAANGGALTAEMFEQLLEASKTQAAMAKLVLDAAGAEGWAAQEAYRQQGDALAKICREMARRLGHDPADQRVADAFEVAVGRVLYGRRRPRAGMKAIEGKVT